jgi:spermidine synthase
MNKDEWFYDHVSPDMVQLHRIRETVYSGKTEFQSVEIIELSSFGRSLVLDGKIQSSEADEFIYHEALVHPAMITHPQPERVFIAGGGEGATLREVLTYPSVKRVVMVDVDKEVIDICRNFLPSLHQGSFDDSRLELHYADARKHLKQKQDKFDVIILDLPEPIEEGPAYLLHTKQFYELIRRRLTSQGIAVFPLVFPYRTEVPSYGGMWGFVFASQRLNPLHLTADEVNHRISARTKRSLRFYDGLTHHGMFLLPKCLRGAIDREKRVITDKKPLFVHQPEPGLQG